MCGIAGVVQFEGQPRIDGAKLAAMRDAMAHRGPDGFGQWFSDDGRVGLAHRRLSIIDLSTAANQPMGSEDGAIQIVFNGEIYNHAEIRAELEALGRHTWQTSHSDTEMILHAYEQWGIDAIHRFRGMFAFGLWDAREEVLWLVRDRIGIKPMYYSIHHGRITFASEIKALLADPDQQRAVNEEAFYHYLSFLASPAPMTLFEGIHKLPGGCWLRIDRDGTVRQERYWDAWDGIEMMHDESEETIAERLIEELRTSVQYRKVSDVPVGVFLSGGIDSSTNTALFSEGEGSPVKTFSIGYQGDYQSYRNELDYARLMADRVGAQYHELLLTVDDMVNFLPTMIKLQDEPIADPVCVPVYYVSKLARDNGVTVAQVGEGADELFFGYPGWKRTMALQQADNLPVPNALKKAGLPVLEALGHKNRSWYEWLRRGSMGQPVFWGGAEAFFEPHKPDVLSPRLKNQFRGYSSWEALAPIYDRYQANTKEVSPLSWMTYLDLNLRLPELLLMRVDKMSMGVSLEGRVPFLDHEFVQLALSIPTEVKTRGGTLKHILKKAVRGLIPDELIDRRKQGFGVPVHEWFFERLGGEIERELADFCQRTDYLNPKEVQRLIDAKNPHQAWYLLNFALWHKEYIE